MARVMSYGDSGGFGMTLIRNFHIHHCKKCEREFSCTKNGCTARLLCFLCAVERRGDD